MSIVLTVLKTHSFPCHYLKLTRIIKLQNEGSAAKLSYAIGTDTSLYFWSFIAGIRSHKHRRQGWVF